MRSFVDGKNRLLGTSQISAFMEASLEKSNVILKVGDAVLNFSLSLLMLQEAWKQRASWPED